MEVAYNSNGGRLQGADPDFIRHQLEGFKSRSSLKAGLNAEPGYESLLGKAWALQGLAAWQRERSLHVSTEQCRLWRHWGRPTWIQLVLSAAAPVCVCMFLCVQSSL